MADDQTGINMLVASLLDANRVFTQKLDAALERMATREDIINVREDIKGTVGRREFELITNQLTARVDIIEKSVNELIASRLPKWFWPAAMSLFGGIVPLCVVLATHYWKVGP
jgi:hypothetical protein